jgi:hemolysin activation/secretion protein
MNMETGMARRITSVGLMTGLALGTSILAGAAFAQEEPTAANDAPSTASIGVDLSGIVLLGPSEPVRTSGAGTVTTDGLLVVSGASLAATLQPLIGRPISEAMIAEIEAEIVSAYRNAGYPFVAVATPPQEITTGVLNLRVVPFRAAQITASGTSPEVAAQVVAGVRQQSGALIDAATLEEDLEWLNRTPLRRIGAEFNPGTAPSTTNITLDVTEDPGIQFTAGYSNTGSTSTGTDRLSFGATVGDLLLPGSVLSYRATVGTLTAPGGEPAYLGQTLQFSVPLAARQEMSILLSLTDTIEETDPFIVESRTEEIVIGYATALSNFTAWPGDVRIAFESREQTKDLFFGEDIFLSQDVFATRQFVFGWSNQWRSSIPAGAFFRHEIEAAVHFSPGDIGSNNSDADLAAFSDGRATSANYAYLTGGYDISWRLESGRRISFGIDGQISGEALPETEQLAIGGLEAVRGYTSEDGAYDRGLIMRSEIGLSAQPIRRQWFAVNPYAFLDAGFGRDLAQDEADLFAGVGVGATMSLGPNGSATLVVGVPLIDGPENEAGQPRLDFNVNFRF